MRSERELGEADSPARYTCQGRPTDNHERNSPLPKASTAAYRVKTHAMPHCTSKEPGESIKSGRICRRCQSRYAKVFAQIHASDIIVLNNLRGCSGHQYMALMKDISPVHDLERLAHVVIGDQHADTPFF